MWHLCIFFLVFPCWSPVNVRIEFDCRPGAIAQSLALREPKYQETAAYCHFGREPVTKKLRSHLVHSYAWIHHDEYGRWGSRKWTKITQWSKTGFKTDILINSSCRGPLHKCIIADWGRCFRAKAVQTCSLWVSRIFKDFFIPSFDRVKTLDPRDGIKFFEWENAKDWLWYYNRCVYQYEAAVLTFNHRVNSHASWNRTCPSTSPWTPHRWRLLWRAALISPSGLTKRAAMQNSGISSLLRDVLCTLVYRFS